MKKLSKNMIFCLNYSNVHASLIKKIDGALSPHGISFTEYLVLYHLYNAQLQNGSSGSMRRIDLAESVGLSASGITRLIAPMEKIGLVQKQVKERDARVSLVKITKAGGDIFEHAGTSFDHAAAYLLGGLDAKELDSGLKLLRLLGGKI
ncbi:MAG: MarR family transcriptional regulator [SAR324 cluster bacterium]|nr:MarR family transcriptional regulator [SAR324 cluster bacterium]